MILMTAEQIDLVRKSFARVEPIAEQAGALFYAKLFDLDPGLRRLFKGDVKEQSMKLMQVIAFAVEKLERFDELVPHLAELGARHKNYGAENRDYDTVAAALLWTLEKALRGEFDADTRHAWQTLYRALAQAMIRGASQRSENAVKV